MIRNNQKTKKKEKRRLIDETVRRLFQEIHPIRGWIWLSAFLCLLLIGCAVAAPKLLGSLVDQLYAWTKEHTPGLAERLLPGAGLLFGVYALQAAMTYGNSFLLNNVVHHAVDHVPRRGLVHVGNGQAAKLLGQTDAQARREEASDDVV